MFKPSHNIRFMDIHSRKLYLLITIGALFNIFQHSASANYYSFGRTVNKSFGDPNDKNITVIEDIIVPVSGIVRDIDLAINIAHTSICDLQVYLISPAGTEACINSYNVRTFKPGKINFYWTIFDAESPIGIDSGKAPYTGLFRPNGPDSLTAFYGQQSYGTWKVAVTDWIYGDTGTFKGVRLDFNISKISLVPEPSTICLLGFPAIIGIFRRKANRLR